ncbi:MAG TPA: hypothetical protein VNC79_03735, partial [Mycobacteriales bacterium]|nr:hypothetical protein [Mycobacteriales bacterium]
MIGQGLVPPLVLPGAVGAGGADLNQLLAVSARFGLGVDVAVAAGSMQQPVDGAPLPLETVIAPNPGFATFVPAGLDRIPDGNDGVPLPTGALDRDAWAIQTDLKAVMPLYPTEFPVPALWLLEGVDAATVPAVLDQWLGGSVEGVAPETQACHDSAAAGEQGATPEDSYRNRMLAGTWREMLYAAEAALGLASGAGLNPTLTVRAFDENLAEIPVAAVLEATAVVDPVLLGAHPLVLLTAGLAANLPVSIHLRFDVWDVDLATASDSKGAVRPLRPETIRLVADDGGDQLPDLAIQWVDPYAVAELPRSQLEGRSFHAEVDFPPGTTIRLERGQAFTWPFQGDPATWSTAGWTAKSGTASGSWENFSGVQIGSEISPATFWVGTKVRLRLAFEEQVRDPYGVRKSSRVRTRRLAPGHEVALYALRGIDYYDWFTTDADGDVSGVSFAVPAGGALGVAVRRHLVDPFGVELSADDEPDDLYEQVHGAGSAATRVRLFGDSDFLSED